MHFFTEIADFKYINMYDVFRIPNYNQVFQRFCFNENSIRPGYLNIGYIVKSEHFRRKSETLDKKTGQDRNLESPYEIYCWSVNQLNRIAPTLTHNTPRPNTQKNPG